jgi:acyl-CoA hydrolase
MPDRDPGAGDTPTPPPDLKPKPASVSRVSLAVLTNVAQSNGFGTLHGGVLLRLADECGASAASRHAGGGRVTTAAIDSFAFLGPVHPGERLEIDAEVTYAGRTSVETRIEAYAEPFDRAERRKVAAGYGLYVALDAEGKPRRVPPVLSVTEADRARDAAAQARQAARLARRDEARAERWGADAETHAGG